MNIVVLAAGQGKRMRSDLPKVLHPLAGKPLLAHVIATARALKPSMICVVYGHGGERVRERLTAQGITWVKQEQQLGTGHAVLQALPHLDPTFPTLVLYGDVPLIRPETLQRLMQSAREKSQGQCVMALLTAHLDNPKGYGRIVRTPAKNGAEGAIQRIVEEKTPPPKSGKFVRRTPASSSRRPIPCAVGCHHFATRMPKASITSRISSAWRSKRA